MSIVHRTCTATAINQIKQKTLNSIWNGLINNYDQLNFIELVFLFYAVFAASGGFVPWQYMEEQMRLAALAASNQFYVDDTEPAFEGELPFVFVRLKYSINIKRLIAQYCVYKYDSFKCKFLFFI